MSGGICNIPPLASQIPDLSSTYAISQSNPADPAGTTSATGVLMGLGNNITTKKSGKIIVLINGIYGITNANLSGGQMSCYWGTGINPVNGAAITGTQFLAANRLVGENTISEQSPFTMAFYVAGLDKTGATTYWIDISLLTSAGTIFIKNISCVLIELP